MKKIISLVASVAILGTTEMYAKKQETKVNEVNKVVGIEKIADVNFIAKNPNISVKEVIDRGEVWQVKVETLYGGGMQPFDVFITKSKKYVFLGTGFDDKTGTRLETPYDKKRYEEMQKAVKEHEKFVANYIKEKDIEKDAAFTYGSGTKKFYVFTDPECPYCKKLEQMMPQLEKDAKFFVYLYPLPMHPNAKDMSLYILNSDKPMEALLQMADGSIGDKYKQIKCVDAEKKEVTCPPEKLKELDAKLSKQISIGTTLQVMGTPTVYDENGVTIVWPDLPSIVKRK